MRKFFLPTITTLSIMLNLSIIFLTIPYKVYRVNINQPIVFNEIHDQNKEILQNHIAPSWQPCELECEIQERKENNQYFDYFLSNSYRLYYGEWIVAEHVASDSRLTHLTELQNNDFIESMVGSTITIRPNIFIFGENEYINFNPRYQVAIIPQNPISYVSDFLPSAEELGICTPFFVFIHINLSGAQIGGVSPPANFEGFFIKDDNTLYLLDVFNVFKLERISHISEDSSIFYRMPHSNPFGPRAFS